MSRVGADMRAAEAGEGGNPWKGDPLEAERDLIPSRGRKRGGKWTKGNGNHSHVKRDSRGRERPGQQVEDCKGGKHMDERWKPAGGVDVQVDGHSAPGQGGGEKQVQKREVDRSQILEDGGKLGVRPGGEKEYP